MKIVDKEKFKVNKKLNGLIYAIKSDGKVKNYDYYSKLNKKEYKKEIKEWYYDRMHDYLDLKNPKNFNQKIQYLKLNDCSEIKTKLTDKYKCRSWIEENIGKEYLVPLIGAWDNFADIDFDKLPNQFVIKCNHGSGFNYVVTDKSKLDINDLKEKIIKWMNIKFTFIAGFEIQYSSIKPKIICEEYLGDNLIDIQFWCAKGKVLFISYIHSPHGENTKATFDEDWNRLDFYTSQPIYEGKVTKPKKLKEMIKIAKNISKEFKFIRVDFYITNKEEILISELTFTPASGCCGWYPADANEKIGNMIDVF